MNLLFNALFITLLLLPGVIVRLSYLNIAYGKKTFRSSFVEELLLSLIPTFIIQSLGFAVTQNRLDINTIYLLLINSDKTINYQLTRKSIGLFIIYCLVVYTICWILGSILRKIVKKYSLDIRIPILRLHNEWYYHLKGFITEDDKGRRTFIKTDNVWLDILVDNKEASYLYSGILYEFILSKDEGLNFLCLNGVRRRKLQDDKLMPYKKKDGENIAELVNAANEIEVSYDDNEYDIENEKTKIDQLENYMDERYYDMPGQNFIVPYAEVKNINIIYFREVSIQA